MKIVYIDSQNIHKSVQELGWTIDRTRFFDYLKRKFEVDTVKIFFGYVSKYEKFYAHLKKLDMKLYSKKQGYYQMVQLNEM